MRVTVFAAALIVLGTTACLRSSSGPDVDASSNGMNGNGPDGSTGSNNNNNPDAGNNGSNTNNPDAGNTSGFQCKNKVTSYGNGHHNAGQDCMQCHGDFGLAGTLYTTATGSTAIAGATITVKDASGQMFDMVTQANGNFYTTNSVVVPRAESGRASARSARPAQMMVSQVQSSSGGGCNMSGCHRTTGQGHIHLP